MNIYATRSPGRRHFTDSNYFVSGGGGFVPGGGFGAAIGLRIITANSLLSPSSIVIEFSYVIPSRVLLLAIARLQIVLTDAFASPFIVFTFAGPDAVV